MYETNIQIELEKADQSLCHSQRLSNCSPTDMRFNRVGLNHFIYTSSQDVPTEEWNHLTADDMDVTMDRRLIGAYEATMGGQCRTFTIVIRNRLGEAIALACVCLFSVDAGLFPWLNALVMRARKVWRNCLKIRVLFCGLPIPAGQNHIRISPRANRAAVLRELDIALGNLASDQGAGMVVFMQFSPAECEGLQPLVDRGYLRSELPARHLLLGEFGSFANYLDALKARYRSEVNRSLKKFTKAGLRVEYVLGPVDLPRVYTDEVHRLYEAVEERSSYRLEHYPAEFIRELGRQFGNDASLTCIYQDRRLVAFTIGLMRDSIYHNLYSGVDYDLLAQSDLYFNLFYHDLNYAWQRGASAIHLGQTADDFKSRLGSKSEPMYALIRSNNRMLQMGLKTFSKWALPEMKSVAAHHVFKGTGLMPYYEPRRGAVTRD